MTHSMSLPGLTRQSIPLEFQTDRAAEWMPGSRPGMTDESFIMPIGISPPQWRILRWPKVGWASGMGGICQVPVTGTTVSRLIGTSMTVGMSERIASR
jgi:hypothetical protein